MPKIKLRNRRKIKPKPIRWKSDAEVFETPAQPRPTVEFPRPETNSKMEFTLVPGFPDNHPKAFIQRSPLGGKSVYEVNFIFSIPGVNTLK